MFFVFFGVFLGERSYAWVGLGQVTPGGQYVFGTCLSRLVCSFYCFFFVFPFAMRDIFFVLSAV